MIQPDLLLKTLRSSISKLLGVKNLSAAQTNLRKLALETKADEPILIVSSSDVDPNNCLKDLAKKDKCIYSEISAEKDKDTTILQQIKKAAEKGQWISLKNIHLSTSLFVFLDNELKKLQPQDSFRLWLVGSVDLKDPANNYDNCKKIVLELPSSLKHKIFYFTEQYEAVLRKETDSKNLKIYIALIILHAILIERRTFIPQGK